MQTPRMHGSAGFQAELNFDQAIELDSFDVAEAQIDLTMQRLGNQIGGDVYPRRLTKIALKQAFMPVYVRTSLDKMGISDPSVDRSVLDVYPHLTQYLALIKPWYLEARSKGNTPLGNQLSGDMSKVMLSALSAYLMKGTAEDPFSIVPATLGETVRQNPADRRGPVADYDSHLFNRRTRQERPTLLTTGRFKVGTLGTERQLDPAVLVVRLAHLVRQNSRTAFALQDALIADNTGNATSEQKETIERLSKRLLGVYTHAFGEAALNTSEQ